MWSKGWRTTKKCGVCSYTLTELNYTMYFRWNKIFNAWNGCLYKEDGKPKIFVNGIPNFIKCFVYNTKKECIEAATTWANNNPHSLNNYKG